jgi:hypothetical protein
MQKISFLLILASSNCIADAKDIRNMLNTFAPQPQVIYIQPNNHLYPLPPINLQPILGKPNLNSNNIDLFGGAKLNETPVINLYD